MIFIDTATLSLNGAMKPAEEHITLWCADGTSASAASIPTTSGSLFLADGTTTLATTKNSTTTLFNLLSSWNASLQFALEVSIQIGGTVSTLYVALWDMTSNTLVSASQISSTTSPMQVLRSGKLTLTPGHAYGVTTWASSASENSIITDAKLIVFP